VSVSFGQLRVLRDISFHVEPGEIVSLVGPSGAGKTTFLKLCNATVRPSAGRILRDGTPLASFNARELRHLRACAGFVHQDHALVPNLRVLQNVSAGRLGRRSFMAGLRSMLWPARQELIEMHALLARVGIEGKMYQRTDSLSGGQQQRVAIARALWQGPSLLLADEPVASVDPARARDVIRFLVEIAKERDLTLVISLHDLELAREFFPRLIGIRNGRLVLDGKPGDIAEAEFVDLYRLNQDLPEDLAVEAKQSTRVATDVPRQDTHAG
jgi:phosphonate transport system ATP-binding protein